MTERAWTPGPWRIDVDWGDGEPIYDPVIAANDGYRGFSYVAQTSYDSLSYTQRPLAEWKANTLLISKAPELVEALEALLERWDAVLPALGSAQSMPWIHGWQYDGPEGGMEHVVKDARALLATLQGETDG